MANEVITFDIETIPQQAPLSPAQEEEFLKRRVQFLKRSFPEPKELGFPDYTDEQKEAVRGITMATSPYLGEICCIGLHKDDGNGNKGSIALVGDEKEILTRFWSNLENYRGLFVSFNGLDFDVPFIVKRSLHHRIKPTNNNFLDLKRFSRWPHFDVKAVIGDFDKFATGNLDLICDFLGIASPKHGEIKADGVEQAFIEGKIDLIGEYCVRDVESTYNAYKILKDYTFDINKKNQ